MKYINGIVRNFYRIRGFHSEDRIYFAVLCQYQKRVFFGFGQFKVVKIIAEKFSFPVYAFEDVAVSSRAYDALVRQPVAVKRRALYNAASLADEITAAAKRVNTSGVRSVIIIPSPYLTQTRLNGKSIEVLLGFSDNEHTASTCLASKS